MTSLRAGEMPLLGDALNGERLRIAREFRQITQRELATRVGASNALISQYEAGLKRYPPADLASAWAEVLGFETGYFFGSPVDAFQREECSFRHQRAATESLKGHVIAHGTLLGVVLAKLREHVRFPKLNLPSFPFNSPDGIETAAERTRTHWGLSLEAPMAQPGRVLENAGVVIVPHIVKSRSVDAFSRQGSTTVLFLNQAIQSTSRWHFDIGHECGHLVMHAGHMTGSADSEAAADRFASALLMPKRAFSREFGGRRSSIPWAHIFELKRHWRVSAAAIIRRAFDLDLIGGVEYRRAYQYMSSRGWRSGGEPDEPEFQQPELLMLALSALGTSVRLTASELCQSIHFTPETFTQVTGFDIPAAAPKSPFLVVTQRPSSPRD